MPSVHRDMEIRKGVCLRTGEDVVIKIRRKRGSFQNSRDEYTWRANTELLLNMPHCNGIARIHHVLEDQDAYYVVMEKANGRDLYESLHSEGELTAEEVKGILRQLLEAVGELHDNGCIHKDLKLENVMLDRKACWSSSDSIGQASQSTASAVFSPYSSRYSSERSGSEPMTPGVKLIDFDTVEEWSPKSPKAVDVLGTDQYIAPEAYDGRYSPGSDIFAVGVIVYRLLTGKFPFRRAIFNDQPGENWVGSPKMKEIRDKLHHERIDWSHAVFEHERGLQQLLVQMLSVKEAARPTAREALADPCLAPGTPPAHRCRPTVSTSSQPVGAFDRIRSVLQAAPHPRPMKSQTMAL